MGVKQTQRVFLETQPSTVAMTAPEVPPSTHAHLITELLTRDSVDSLHPSNPELIGKTQPLSAKWQDPDDPDNPYALDPTFGFGRLRVPLISEQHLWKHGHLHESGTVLKGNNPANLDHLAELWNKVSPIAEELGVEIGAIYDRSGLWRGYNYLSKPNFMTEEGSGNEAVNDYFKKTILLNSEGDSKDLLPLLRGLAHTTHPIHDEAFEERYQQIVDTYCQHYPQEVDLLRQDLGGCSQ